MSASARGEDCEGLNHRSFRFSFAVRGGLALAAAGGSNYKGEIVGSGQHSGVYEESLEKLKEQWTQFISV
jgi:hypothetical protein